METIIERKKRKWSDARKKRKWSDATLSLIEYLKSTKIKSCDKFPTLREVVIKSIAKNLKSWIASEVEVENKDQINSRQFKFKFLSTKDTLAILIESIDINYASPFECLSTKDTLAILNEAIDINYDEKRCLKLFLHRGLRAFDFSRVSLLNRIMAFKYFTKKCKVIKELLFSCPDRIIARSYPGSNLTISSKEVMQLNKMSTFDYHNFLESCFGCNFVEVLSFTNHKSLKSLKIPCNEIEKSCYEWLSECNQLQKLSLMRPNNLDAETLTKILSSLPMLSSLSLFGNNIDFESLDPDLRFNNMLTLDFSLSKITDEGLQVIVTIMPNITCLVIHKCRDLYSECFDAISKLDNLNALNASISMHGDLNYNDYFEKFLMKQGEKLTSLNLSFVDDEIDTSMLAKYCPNLELLNLTLCRCNISWILKSDLTIDGNSSLYNHLIPFEKENYSLLEVCHRLHTFHFSDENYNEEQLQMLFNGNSKVLRNLELSFFQHEEFITKFLNRFNFKYLEKLDIQLRSGSITKKEVYTILRKNVYLKELNLHNCSLGNEDIEDIKDVIEQSKSNVQINHYYLLLPLIM